MICFTGSAASVAHQCSSQQLEIHCYLSNARLNDLATVMATTKTSWKRDWGPD